MRTLADAIAAGELCIVGPAPELARKAHPAAEFVEYADPSGFRLCIGTRHAVAFVHGRRAAIDAVIDLRESALPTLAAMRWAPAAVWSRFVFQAAKPHEVEISVSEEIGEAGIVRRAEVRSLLSDGYYGSTYYDALRGARSWEDVPRPAMCAGRARAERLRQTRGVLQITARPLAFPMHHILNSVGADPKHAASIRGRPRDFRP